MAAMRRSAQTFVLLMCLIALTSCMGSAPGLVSLLVVAQAADSYLSSVAILWVTQYERSAGHGNAVLMARETSAEGTYDVWLTVRHMFGGGAGEGYAYHTSAPAIGGAYNSKFFVFVTRATHYTPFVDLSAHPEALPWARVIPGTVLTRVAWEYRDTDGPDYYPRVEFGEVESIRSQDAESSIAYGAFGEPGFSGSLVLAFEDANRDGRASETEFWYVGLHNAQSYQGNVAVRTAWVTYGVPEPGSTTEVPLDVADDVAEWKTVSFSSDLSDARLWEIAGAAIARFSRALTGR